MSEERETDQRTGRAAAAARIAQQQTWVDQQIRVAMERGDFDDLPGAGKPIADLGSSHDPDWWVKKLVERERLVVLPPSVQLRKEDGELDDRLDTIASEREVRAAVEDFNQRVVAARYRLPEGPPLVTMPRDLEATVEAWRERRAERAAARRTTQAAQPPRRRWWQRRH
ncbi:MULTISPECIES: J-domain-containing protein [unclassified Nocardioides]|uniref:DnaJ family domain-containing protein n=1 Tax=unclassified Nocardioides TaxID=2615069 RepID=UPI0030142DA6